MEGLDQRVRSQKVSDNLTYCPGANTMDNTHLAQISQEGIIEVAIKRPSYLIGSFPAEVKLLRNWAFT
jgi:hypothetical protein